MDLYVPRVIKDIHDKGRFRFMATNFWNQLPTDVKESTTLDLFKQNYKHSKGRIKVCCPKAQTIDVPCARICAYMFYSICFT